MLQLSTRLMRLRTDRTDQFGFGIDRLWAGIAGVGDYRRRWPWLRDFTARGVVAGDTWQCTVSPPVPYVVRFCVHIRSVEEGRAVMAEISGDICGHARLVLHGDERSSSVRLVARLAPAKWSLRVLSAIARPLVRFGHNWILDAGVRQFERAVSSSRSPVR